MTAVGASKTYTIPVGPLHVALEEPMYFHIDVEGETVREVDIRAGHVHRGVEYLTTKRSIYQNVVLTERICALCSNSHPETFVMAVRADRRPRDPRTRGLPQGDRRRDQAHRLASVQRRHPRASDRLRHPVHVRHAGARDHAGREGDAVRQPHGHRRDVHRRGALRPRRRDERRIFPLRSTSSRPKSTRSPTPTAATTRSCAARAASAC